MSYKLNPAKGSTKNRKRIGRGNATGQGRTAGKGHKGYKSRSGTKAKLHFEGGQTPLARRLPKRGMKIFSKVLRRKHVCQIVNLDDLLKLRVKKINSEILFEKGLIKKKDIPVKILGRGELTKKLDITANAFSASAKEAIEKAGGTATTIEK